MNTCHCPSHDIQPSSSRPQTTIKTRSTPVFDNSKVTVVFVLGGPGAGKGTQCGMLVEDFGFAHLSGTVAPVTEIITGLLKNSMQAILDEGRSSEGWVEGRGRFLIDGFPRKMDQAIKFDETVCKSSLVLYFSTTEEVMLARLLERGKTSGREDDNVDSITKRFHTYKSDTMPVIEHYTKLGQVAEVDSSPPVEQVHKATSALIQDYSGHSACLGAPL
ncbi:P-loop containing nucleoside triphosphate hydrolase protein [Infundibulicybe gibba]|nr:P-loop containing nucleoside triphosphate hydrolase protein [Infundibulicybe gibba]